MKLARLRKTNISSFLSCVESKRYEHGRETTKEEEQRKKVRDKKAGGRVKMT